MSLCRYFQRTIKADMVGKAEQALDWGGGGSGSNPSPSTLSYISYTLKPAYMSLFTIMVSCGSGSKTVTVAVRLSYIHS